ncbi:MAG: Lrp/AsnC ligand binding domain-containing protein [Chloroflexi bacterium]|nr:Lrp/AsnC ligand binding domain-containing protein [Chloroflexota bacterium]
MATRAYVLITTEVGKTKDVVERARKITGVTMADVVAGSYDVVVVLECPDANAIGRVVLNELHGMPGLKNTLTLIAVS